MTNHLKSSAMFLFMVFLLLGNEVIFAQQKPLLYLKFDPEKPPSEIATMVYVPEEAQPKELKAGIVGAVWSVEGDWFAYDSQQGLNEGQSLHVGKLNGESKKLFVAPPKEQLVLSPAWSPNSKQIAIILMRETANPTWEHQADFSIKVVDVETASVATTLEIPVGVLELPMPTTPTVTFRWSPDGKKILLGWASTVVFDVSKKTTISVSKNYSVAEWGPLSDEVLFFDFEQKDGGPWELRGLYRMHLETKKIEEVADRAGLAKSNIKDHPGAYYARLYLSPSASKYAMLVGTTRNDQDRSNLRIYEIQKNKKLELAKPALDHVMTNNRMILQFQWSPDENQIAAIVMKDWNEVSIELFNLESANWKKIVQLPIKIQEFGPGMLEFFLWQKGLSWSD